MPDSIPLPVSSPPPQPPLAEPPKKTQEDFNIEAYEKVFTKCMAAGARIINSRYGTVDKEHQISIATAIFDRFYNDQSSLKAGQLQAKAMIDGMTQVLEGRR